MKTFEQYMEDAGVPVQAPAGKTAEQVAEMLFNGIQKMVNSTLDGLSPEEAGKLEKMLPVIFNRIRSQRGRSVVGGVALDRAVQSLGATGRTKTTKLLSAGAIQQ